MATVDIVSPEEMYRLFRSQVFIDTLVDATRYNLENDDGAGFEIARTHEKEFCFSDIGKGDDGYDGIVDIRSCGDRESYLFFEFETDELPFTGACYYVPDVRELQSEDERGIIGTGHVVNKKNIEVLLVQIRNGITRVDGSDFFKNSSGHKFGSNQQVAEFFRESLMYNSCVLNYNHENGKYKPEIVKEDLIPFSHEVVF
jgi:hypothetical protein